MREYPWADGCVDRDSCVTARGYFGLPRDRIEFDGQLPAPGIPQGVAGVDSTRLRLAVAPGRPVTAAYQSGVISERIVGVAWPASQNRIVMIELQE